MCLVLMSARKRPVSLTIQARQDFEEILIHSLGQWGEVQRDRYALAINQALTVLGDNPQIGRAREDLPPGYRAFPVEQHIILYRVTTRAVSVARIIHGRMDVQRALRRR
jgi:toxin ParE1/3/4